MAVITLANLKIRLGISSSDTSEDDALNALITQVTALAEAFLGYPIEQATRTVFLEGTGKEWLPLPARPVTAVTTTGTWAASSTSITSLGTTTNVVVGMPVVGVGIASGTTVATVASTSCTLSTATTAAGTAARVDFGLSIWEDMAGYWGEGDPSTVFTVDSRLTPGSDYALRLDGTGYLAGLSSSGLVYRLAGYWPRWPRRGTGLLAPFIPGPVFGGGQVKVQFTAGYTSSNLPADLQLALMDIIALARQASPLGMFKTSESWDGYSYSLGGLAEAAWLGYLAGAGGGMLARYKRLAV